MNFNKLTKFAFKNSFRRKSIALLAIFGVAIGVSLQITLNTLSNGMSNQFDTLFNDLVGQVHISESFVSPFQSQINKSVINDLENSNLSSQIKYISPQITLPSSLTTAYSKNGTLASRNSGADNPITILGVDLSSFLEVSTDLSNLTSKSLYFDANSTTDLIVSQSLVDANETYFDISKTVSFQINSTNFMKMNIIGVALPQTNGILGLRNNGDPSYSIWMSIDAAKSIKQAILDDPSKSIGSGRWLHYESKQLSSVNATADSYTQINIKTSLVTINDTNTFMVQLQNFMDNTYHNDFQITSPQLSLDSFTTTQQTFTLFINLISVVSVIAGSMGIIIAQLVGVESRLKEFAILKASGWKNNHLITEVIFESLTLGLIGAIVGLFLSTFFIVLLRRIFKGSISSLILISPNSIINAVILAVIIAIIGGLYPSIKVALVKPMEILRTI